MLWLLSRMWRFCRLRIWSNLLMVMLLVWINAEKSKEQSGHLATLFEQLDLDAMVSLTVKKFTWTPDKGQWCDPSSQQVNESSKLLYILHLCVLSGNLDQDSSGGGPLGSDADPPGWRNFSRWNLHLMNQQLADCFYRQSAVIKYPNASLRATKSMKVHFSRWKHDERLFLPIFLKAQAVMPENPNIQYSHCAECFSRLVLPLEYKSEKKLVGNTSEICDKANSAPAAGRVFVNVEFLIERKLTIAAASQLPNCSIVEEELKKSNVSTTLSTMVSLQCRKSGLRCFDIDECTEKIHTCNKHALCNNMYGSYVCKCEDKYTGDGHHCVKRCRPLKDEIKHGYVKIIPQQFFGVGAVANYTCKPKFQLSDGKKSRFLECGGDLNWNDTEPEKCVAACHIPDEVSKTMDWWEKQTELGKQLVFQCKLHPTPQTHWRLNGSKKTTCLDDDGEWSASFPRCVEAESTTSHSPSGSNSSVTGVLLGLLLSVGLILLTVGFILFRRYLAGRRTRRMSSRLRVQRGKGKWSEEEDGSGLEEGSYASSGLHASASRLGIKKQEAYKRVPLRADARKAGPYAVYTKKRGGRMPEHYTVRKASKHGVRFEGEAMYTRPFSRTPTDGYRRQELFAAQDSLDLADEEIRSSSRAQLLPESRTEQMETQATMPPLMEGKDQPEERNARTS